VDFDTSFDVRIDRKGTIKMRSTALIAVLFFLSVVLSACSSTAPENDISGSAATSPGITGHAQGADIYLDRALVTTRNRTLGLALFKQGTNPEMMDLDPGAWFLGLSFKYDHCGPEISLDVVDCGQIHPGSVARGRLMQANRHGKPFPVRITGGTLRINDWTVTGELITEISGTVHIRTVGNGILEGAFTAPVQGWYLAP